MSKFPGGIFSKASGQVSGLVFSEARTRTGKVMTARGLTIPTNPQTNAQQTNRESMRWVIKATQHFGPGIYRNDWDNTDGNNAGWSSLISIQKSAFTPVLPYTSALVSEVGSIPPETDLGELHTPNAIAVMRMSPGNYRIGWSTETGTNGSPSDQAVVIGLRSRVNNITPITGNIFKSTSAIRGDSFVDVSIANEPASGSTAILTALYFRSALPEPENLSEATWLTAPNT